MRGFWIGILGLLIQTAQAVEVQWSASPLQAMVLGPVDAMREVDGAQVLSVAAKEIQLSNLPAFVDVTQLLGSDFQGYKRPSPAGPQYAAKLSRKGRDWLVLGVNAQVERIAPSFVSIRAGVDQRITIHKQQRILLTLKSGQSGSVRANGQLWCVFATLDVPQDHPDLARESGPKLTWVLMASQSARQCRAD